MSTQPEPATEAGRRLLDRMPYWRNFAHRVNDEVTEVILAIEAEAVEAEERRIEAFAAHMDEPEMQAALRQELDRLHHERADCPHCAQATAAARAEVARQVRDAADAIDRFLKDKRETGIADHIALAAVASDLRALLDAAPRQQAPTGRTGVPAQPEAQLSEPTGDNSDLTAALVEDGERDRRLVEEWDATLPAAPDTTTGTTDE